MSEYHNLEWVGCLTEESEEAIGRSKRFCGGVMLREVSRPARRRKGIA